MKIQERCQRYSSLTGGSNHATRLPALPLWVRHFADDEFGGAYTLSYVMVIPFLMLLVALTVESALMLSAKIGTVYSAYAAVRSASVYGTQRSWGETINIAEQAARQAMLPFASGATSSGAPPSGSVGESISSNLDETVAAYEDWTGNGVASGYLRAKAADAAERLSVAIGSQPTDWDSELQAVVTYKFPFHLPGIGQLLGKQDSDGGYVFELRSSATIANDGPQNATQELGIGYGTPR